MLATVHMKSDKSGNNRRLKKRRGDGVSYIVSYGIDPMV
jgi:hypothetical protein